MSIEEFTSQAWERHAKEPGPVFASLARGLALATTGAHLVALGSLVVHVGGEHLGRWDDALALLDRLEGHAAFDAASGEGKTLRRARAVLHLAAGRDALAERAFESGRTGGAETLASDRIRVLAVLASALAGQKRADEAIGRFQAALALAGYGPGRDDPAARALAVTGNNLAVELEERPTLSPAEMRLMLDAATAGRRFWAIAGSWREAERAEYRLALCHLRAGDVRAAIGHANSSVAIVQEHGSEPGELFFALEALARARHAAGEGDAARAAKDRAAALLPSIEDAGFRDLCATELAKLAARIGA